ncbi:MAG: hypothetical protein WA220_06290 [Candidatus Nitrosopolaris sp.]
MADTNPAKACLWAHELVQPENYNLMLPTDLIVIDKRLEIVKIVEECLWNEILKDRIMCLKPQLFEHYDEARKINFLNCVTEKSNPSFTTAKGKEGEQHDKDLRTSIVLNIWSGCISAAKTISRETMDGPTYPKSHRDAFVWIDNRSKTDPMFRAGDEE